ncbi:MAG: putative membrane protein [Cryomorphaceae bacterium]|jgi:putative membrane protein
MRSAKDYLFLALKGVGMGAADVVPGVSGGTIAFITGIYEELIDTINRVNFVTIQILFKEGIKPFWKALNGNFLVGLFAGIFISLVTFAKLITYLLETHPIAIWSFFFGLVIASIPLVAKSVRNWSGSRYFGFTAGAIIAYLITNLPPVEDSGAMWYLFVSGMIAICAMILPGISGSFILLLLGSYSTVLQALNDRDFLSIAVFGGGCLVGILAFSRFLKWMFGRYHDVTIAVLSGFLLGSLNKIWPWKNTLEYFVKHEGEPNEEKVALVQENILPSTYETLTGLESEFIIAIALALLGVLMIVVMDRFSPKKT